MKSSTLPWLLVIWALASLLLRLVPAATGVRVFRGCVMVVVGIAILRRGRREALL